MNTSTHTARAEEWRQLTVICLGAFLFFNSFGGVNVALSTIQIHFGASLAAVQWISIMGTVTISSLSFCFGRAGVSLYALGAGLAASPLALGLIMATLPLFTALSSPLSGRLADRFEARLVASLGVAFVFIGIFFYSRLGTGSSYILVILALALIGVGSGFFMPANQKAAFSSVGGEHYGILSAMLSSFGTAAGTLETTLAVALIEGTMSGGEEQNPESFAGAQQFAFTVLLPLTAVAFLVSLGEKRKEQQASGNRH